MAWRGSISRSITMTARSIRASASASSSYSSLSAAGLPAFSSPSRLVGLGFVQSLMPMQGAAIARLTSHVSTCQLASCKVMTRQKATVASMVGDKRNIKDYKRRLLASKYELRRKLYKALCMDPNLPLDLREKNRDKLSRLPRNSSFTRVRNRCIFSGRPRAGYKLFRTSRIVFRTLASEGSLMGIKKASW